MTETNCELCSSASSITTYEVPHLNGGLFPKTVRLCATCRQQLESPETLDSRHWRCLNESIWAENVAAKVLAWRVLHKLSAESWAMELLDQLYLEDDAMERAKAGSFKAAQANPGSDEQTPAARDSNGTVLAAGDSVTLIKDLDVKGANFTAKRGLLVKNITLTDDPALVEGRVNGTTIVLKTCFLKKSN